MLLNTVDIKSIQSNQIEIKPNQLTINDFKIDHNLHFRYDEDYFTDSVMDNLIENMSNLSISTNDDLSKYVLISDNDNSTGVYLIFDPSDVKKLNMAISENIDENVENDNENVHLQSLNGLIPTYDLNNQLNYIELYDGSFATIDASHNIIGSNNNIMQQADLNQSEQYVTSSLNENNVEEEIDLKAVLSEESYQGLLTLAQATGNNNLHNIARSLNLI